MPLTTDRNTPELANGGNLQSYGAAASTILYAGALVMLNASGYAVPGAAATGQIAAGRAEGYVDNSAGANADKAVTVRRGVFRYDNSASADLITIAEIGDDCYIVDDQTVAKTDGTGTRSVAGKVVNVDSLGVWVKIGI